MADRLVVPSRRGSLGSCYWCPQIHSGCVTAPTSKRAFALLRKASPPGTHAAGRSLHSVIAAVTSLDSPAPAGRQHLQQPVMCCQPRPKQSAKQERPDISLLEQALQLQWDRDANAHLGNIVIKPKSNKKAWWKCAQRPSGHPHRWEATVVSRTLGNGCPQCSGRKACQLNCLATLALWAAAQWDHDANTDLGNPNTITAQSRKSAHWCCYKCGHRWVAPVHNRTQRTTGCPRCVSRVPRASTKRPTFADSQHPILAEWDHKCNAARGYFPHKITEGSSKQIQWLCSRCPAGQEHSWSAQPATRTGKVPTGCPMCAGRVACKCNSLPTHYPEIAADWDYSRNLGQPGDHPASSHHLAWWHTAERGSWQQTIHDQTNAAHQRLARLERVRQRQLASQQLATE